MNEPVLRRVFFAVHTVLSSSLHQMWAFEPAFPLTQGAQQRFTGRIPLPCLLRQLALDDADRTGQHVNRLRKVRVHLEEVRVLLCAKPGCICQHSQENPLREFTDLATQFARAYSDT